MRNRSWGGWHTNCWERWNIVDEVLTWLPHGHLRAVVDASFVYWGDQTGDLKTTISEFELGCRQAVFLLLAYNYSSYMYR